MQGIKFFNINSGEEATTTSEPMMAAFLASSDRGVNASKGQDFGWRLSAEDTVELESTMKDKVLMATIASSISRPVNEVSESDVLEYMMKERIKEAEAAEETVGAFESKYNKELEKVRKGTAAETVENPQPNSDKGEEVKADKK